jgi:HlyD family secretion protein
VHVQLGDVVAAGALLFSLDGEQLKNAVEQISAAMTAAQAMVQRAELSVAEASRGLDRDTALAKKGVVPDDTLKLDESRVALARADLAQAKANVDRSRVDLSRAKDALRRAKVVAPQAGTVVGVGIERGQVVTASTGLSASPDAALGLSLGASSGGAPVVIADLNELIVKLDVDELDVGQVKMGQVAIVKAQGIKQMEFVGSVERVGLMGRDAMGAVLFIVEVKIESTRASEGFADAQKILPAPKDVLRPGMTATAEIEVETLNSAVVVPMAAVLEADRTKSKANRNKDSDNGKKEKVSDRVFVVEGTGPAFTVVETAITLGPSDGDVVAVTAGVKPGMRVVEGPFRALKDMKDGDRVKQDDTIDDKDKTKDKK